MEVVDAWDATSASGPSATSVGVFDGVHVGHRQVLAALRRAADREGVRAVVVLLERPPGTSGEAPKPSLLTDVPHRCELLEAAGVDLVAVIPPGEGAPAPSDVVGALAPRVHVTGDEDADDTVTAAVRERGIDVEVVPLVSVDGAEGPVSSTSVRAVVEAGDVALAARLLGRPHEVRGVVEHGDARGRTIGFPTANVAVAGDLLLPASGVYAGWYVGPDGDPRPAAVNVGRRPTFYDEQGLLLVEAHLLDFDGDLYGQPAGVRFVGRLRDEQRFDGIDALASQLQRDIEHARSVLA